jgi:hypothetical protein
MYLRLYLGERIGCKEFARFGWRRFGYGDYHRDVDGVTSELSRLPVVEVSLLAISFIRSVDRLSVLRITNRNGRV